MYLFDFTINILTLLGVVLATGIVVDDAIVVMENIYSKIEHGMDNYKAGYTGSKEIFFAIISTTITLIAVFMPIVFLQGITGRLFREFGVVVAAAVLISSIVSLTLTPMMSTRLLTRTQKEGKMMAAIGQGISWLSEYYGRSLQSFINRRWLAFVVMGISLFIIFIMGSRIPSELAPMEDKGRLLINVTAPEGTSFEAIDEYIYDIASYVDTIPEKKAMIALSAPRWGGGTNRGFVRLLLTQPNERVRSQAQLADQISSYVHTKTFAQS